MINLSHAAYLLLAFVLSTTPANAFTKNDEVRLGTVSNELNEFVLELASSVDSLSDLKSMTCLDILHMGANTAHEEIDKLHLLVMISRMMTDKYDEKSINGLINIYSKNDNDEIKLSLIIAKRDANRAMSLCQESVFFNTKGEKLINLIEQASLIVQDIQTQVAPTK